MPGARLGVCWLAIRSVASIQDRQVLAPLAAADCQAVGGHVTQYALAILGSPPAYRTEDVGPFFDSLNAQVRRGALAWLTPHSGGYNDAALWSRLLETPHDDVRLRVIAEL